MTRNQRKTFKEVLDYYRSLGYPESVATQYAHDIVAVENKHYRKAKAVA